MENPDDLRWIADWNRTFASVAAESDREWRNEFADYLDKRANDLEHKASSLSSQESESSRHASV
jgi:hypothetical protein